MVRGLWTCRLTNGFLTVSLAGRESTGLGAGRLAGLSSSSDWQITPLKFSVKGVASEP